MTRILILLAMVAMVGCGSYADGCHENVCAQAAVAKELNSIFWLIFWFGILGVFGATVNVTRGG